MIKLSWLKRPTRDLGQGALNPGWRASETDDAIASGFLNE